MYFSLLFFFLCRGYSFFFVAYIHLRFNNNRSFSRAFQLMMSIFFRFDFFRQTKCSREKKCRSIYIGNIIWMIIKWQPAQSRRQWLLPQLQWDNSEIWMCSTSQNSLNKKKLNQNSIKTRHKPIHHHHPCHGWAGRFRASSHSLII